MSVKVSICIPTYNNVDEVERLLRSIYMQTYTDFDVHISDDSTNDEIEQLVIASYPQVDYRHNEKPFGHIFNWNEAIHMGNGEYIKVMFSDDWFTDEESLGFFVSMLDEHPKAKMAFCGSRQVQLETGSWYDRCADEAFIARLRKDYRLLFLGNQIGAPSAVIYRAGGKKAFFDEKSNWASDLYLYFDLLSDEAEFAYTTKPLVSIGVHEKQYTESFSEKDERIYQDYKYMFQKYNLVQKEECRHFFLKKYMIPFHKPVKEAYELGIPKKEYDKVKAAFGLDTIRCFLRSRMKKS